MCSCWYTGALSRQDISRTKIWAACLGGRTFSVVLSDPQGTKCWTVGGARLDFKPMVVSAFLVEYMYRSSL